MLNTCLNIYRRSHPNLNHLTKQKDAFLFTLLIYEANSFEEYVIMVPFHNTGTGRYNVFP